MHKKHHSADTIQATLTKSPAVAKVMPTALVVTDLESQSSKLKDFHFI